MTFAVCLIASAYSSFASSRYWGVSAPTMITTLASLAGVSAAATDGTTTPSRADATMTAARTTLRKRELPSDLGIEIRAHAGSGDCLIEAIGGWSRADDPSVRGRVG